MRISLERTQEKIRMKLEVAARDEGSVTPRDKEVEILSRTRHRDLVSKVVD